MPPTAGRRARRVAEPALFAAMAAVFHVVDYALTLGMLGMVLCPLPHALATLRHGTRRGLTAGLAASCVVFALHPLEGPVHLLLFALPGVAAGRALAPGSPRGRAFAQGALVSAAGMAAVTYALGEAAGFGDPAELFPDWLLDGARWSASWPRAVLGEARPLDLVPGLASPATREAWVADLLRAPVGFFLAAGMLWFGFAWFASGLLARRTGHPATLPPLPASPRLPRPAAWLYLVTLLPPVGEGPLLASLRANLGFLLGAGLYASGYLQLLAWGRGRPARGLAVLVAAFPLYWISLWIGLGTSLAPRAGAPPPPPGAPTQERPRGLLRDA